ncbi:methyltransferase-like protein 7A isoform X2 [Daphnia pulicaria]|uniref:methyltransferase-like protein 7A isoform X2 n=1 Tax=Daphnia pulicaria TaxID=35523 RepID=UPI001EEC49E0|nr:methyltransferase-like protein 7A isoform X2 [Daphnia pulicaria]
MSSLLPSVMVGSAIVCLVIKYYNSHIQPWFFSKVYNPSLAVYHVHCREIKRKHFESIKDHKSADPELRKKGALRILEIGPGPGYNFEFYPPNSELTAVEVNRFFEEQFFEKQADHPHIKMERFVVGFAEDMKDVPDNSVDIVVSTMVLCSVRSVEGALKEVHRVLAPGGKYYYWEHIREFKHFWIRLVQHLATYTFYDLVFGCSLNRRSDEIIKANKTGYSSVEQQRFRTPFSNKLFVFHSAHVKGIATK